MIHYAGSACVKSNRLHKTSIVTIESTRQS